MATELSTNEKLARLGAFVVARAAFENTEEPQNIPENVYLTIAKFDLSDCTEPWAARHLIEAYGLDFRECGDELPTIQYGPAPSVPEGAKDAFEARFAEYHDARKAEQEGRADVPLDEADAVIEALLRYANITIK